MKYPNIRSFRRLAAAILAWMLLVLLVSCGQKENSADALGDDTVPVSTQATEPDAELPAETIPATMGTVTTSNLVIRENAGSEGEPVGIYDKGARIEIQETKEIGSTLWGRTGKGWVSMSYVRMDCASAVLGYGVVELGSLNVRSGPGKDHDVVGEVTKGMRYAYYEESDGWVRIEDGWVSTSYFYIEGTAAGITSVGTVISADLNIRTGPGTDFQSVATYQKGDSVDILVQIDGWGYTEKGWISMMHVELQEPTFSTGVATVTSGLNIRKEANADSEQVGTYKKGDVVTILEVENGWGKTDKGWINLLYVKYE